VPRHESARRQLRHAPVQPVAADVPPDFAPKRARRLVAPHAPRACLHRGRLRWQSPVGLGSDRHELGHELLGGQAAEVSVLWRHDHEETPDRFRDQALLLETSQLGTHRRWASLRIPCSGSRTSLPRTERVRRASPWRARRSSGSTCAPDISCTSGGACTRSCPAAPSRRTSRSESACHRRCPLHVAAACSCEHAPRRTASTRLRDPLG